MKNKLQSLFTSDSPHGIRLLLLLGTAIVASSFHVGAAIAEDMHPLRLTFLRFAFASALFAPLVFLKYGFQLPTFGGFLRYSLQSLCLAAFFAAMFQALRFTSALNTGALYTLVPGLTGIMSYFILREKPGLKKSLALLMAMTGALVVLVGGDLRVLTALKFNRGDGIFLVGCLFMSLYGPLVRLFHRGEPMPVLTFWTLLPASGWLFLFSFGVEGDWGAARASTILGIAYLAIFTTFITFMIFQWGILRIGPAETSAYSYLTPAFVLGLGLLLGGEAPHWTVYPGIALTAAAMTAMHGGDEETKSKGKTLLKSQQQ